MAETDPSLAERASQPAGGGPTASVPESTARVPEFFIVGHEKCGTTALYLMLKQHPQVFMPDVKEPRYFATDQRSRLARQTPARRPRTLEGYLSLFADAKPDQRVGEASAQYLRSSAAASAIAQVQPDARIIAILREPASYLRSLHIQITANKVETQRDLRKALALEDDRRRGKRIPRNCHHPDLLMYSEHVRYVEQLRRYHAVFPAENVLVLIYDDFRRDNAATIRRVLRFLDVDEDFTIETVDTYPVKSARFVPLDNLAGAARRARKNPGAASQFSRAMNALIPNAMRSERFRAMWRRAVYTAPRPPDERFMLELRERFKPEVVALSEYLGRDLVSLWGYEGIG